MNKNIVLTGDRPTGKLHIGHYVGSLQKRVEMQNSGLYEMFVFVADIQALTDNATNPEKIKKSVIEVLLDYISVGLDPEKSNIFIQSQIPALSELTMYYMNLVNISRLKRNPTLKEEIKQKNFESNIPVGFFCYPISQAADITAFNANIVPVGEDQLPMLEQTREIVRSFNSIYGDTLTEPSALLPSKKSCNRLPGTDGKNKMSKSLGNCIYLSDSSEEIKKKVMSMFTDPNHLKIEDPGNTENNPVFIYLDAFCDDLNELNKIKNHYQKGGLGDVKVKNYLNEIIQAKLEPIRNKRLDLSKNLDYIYNIIKKGNKKACEVSNQTLLSVKKAIGIDYIFNK